MYFIAGSGDGGASAKFQLSFAYRFFEADEGEGLLAWARDLQMAYTQTSVMDLSEKSLPFRDSSYRPSLFIDHRTEGAGLVPDYLRYGIEHESNGRDGPTNRSLNTVFAWPFWAVPLGERHLYLAPKLYAYLSKAKENADIQEYRGFADLYAAYGNPRGLLGRVVGRMGTTGRGSVQLDLSYPVREEQIPRLGGYLFLQVFSGYGETILGYDRSQAIQVRAGYAIIR
jgi:outer membrane phospholipase A